MNQAISVSAQFHPNPLDRKYRVVVAEAVPALRTHIVRLLSRILSTNDLAISEVSNGQDCVKSACALKPDLVIMDISMPLLNGIKAAQLLWSQFPELKILFWTQYHREIYIRDLAKFLPDEAIHGYVLKTRSDEEIIHSIRSVLLLDIPYIDSATSPTSTHPAKKFENLSDVELETLHDMCLGLTDKAIAIKRHISVRGVRNRIMMIEARILRGSHAILGNAAGLEIYNTRTRTVFEAFRRGLIDADGLTNMNQDLQVWITDVTTNSLTSGRTLIINGG